MMKTEPKNKNVCLWQYNIAHATLSMAGANNGDKVREIENLVKLWGALKPAKVLPQAEAQECHDNAAAMSDELARAYHSESAKTKNPDTLAYAEKLYKVYLEVFHGRRRLRADAVLLQPSCCGRARRTRRTRASRPSCGRTRPSRSPMSSRLGKVDPKLMKESAYAAVLGWKNALNVDPRAKQQAEIEDPTRVATVKSSKGDKKPSSREAPPDIPEREQKMLAAFDIYINYIKDPKDDELVGMKFLKANIYRRYNHFDEAIPIFQDILDHHRQHETAEYSANFLLDIYQSRSQRVRRDARARRQARSRTRSSSRARTT